MATRSTEAESTVKRQIPAGRTSPQMITLEPHLSYGYVAIVHLDRPELISERPASEWLMAARPWSRDMDIVRRILSGEIDPERVYFVPRKPRYFRLMVRAARVFCAGRPFRAGWLYEKAVDDWERTGKDNFSFFLNMANDFRWGMYDFKDNRFYRDILPWLAGNQAITAETAKVQLEQETRRAMERYWELKRGS